MATNPHNQAATGIAVSRSFEPMATPNRRLPLPYYNIHSFSFLLNSRQRDTPRADGQQPAQDWDRGFSQLRTGGESSATSVRISRKDLRRMSDQEVKLRKSSQPQDVSEATLPTGKGYDS